MAKSKEKQNGLSEFISDLREISIREAVIKDGICNYSYDILQGVGEGATHSVKGPGIVKKELTDAYERLNVHLAAIDEIFKHSAIEVTDIDKLHKHDLTGLYDVTGFKIKGSIECESIILSGTKYVSSAGGRIDMKTPKIDLDNLSSYKWYNELKDAINEVRRGVEKYHGGYYDPIEVETDEDEKENKKQGKLFAKDAAAEVLDQDFENAAV